MPKVVRPFRRRTKTGHLAHASRFDMSSCRRKFVECFYEEEIEKVDCPDCLKIALSTGLITADSYRTKVKTNEKRTAASV